MQRTVPLRRGALALFLTLTILSVSLSTGWESARAETRVALVIGNGAYQYAPALTNPANDAKDIATMLDGLGFQTLQSIDSDRTQMAESLLKFAGGNRGVEDANPVLTLVPRLCLGTQFCRLRRSNRWAKDVHQRCGRAA